MFQHQTGGFLRWSQSNEIWDADMGIWLLATVCTLVWFLWVLGSGLSLHADQLENKRPEDAGVSIAPIIPCFPIAAVLFAMLIDLVIAPWGTRVIATLHGLIAVAFLVGIVNVIRRIRSHQK